MKKLSSAFVVCLFAFGVLAIAFPAQAARGYYYSSPYYPYYPSYSYPYYQSYYVAPPPLVYTVPPAPASYTVIAPAPSSYAPAPSASYAPAPTSYMTSPPPTPAAVPTTTQAASPTGITVDQTSPNFTDSSGRTCRHFQASDQTGNAPETGTACLQPDGTWRTVDE